jgi:hypothetical protein
LNIISWLAFFPLNVMVGKGVKMFNWWNKWCCGEGQGEVVDGGELSAK